MLSDQELHDDMLELDRQKVPGFLWDLHAVFALVRNPIPASGNGSKSKDERRIIDITSEGVEVLDLTITPDEIEVVDLT